MLIYTMFFALVIYLAIAKATFDKFKANGLTPRNKIGAFLFTPIFVAVFFVILAFKFIFTSKELAKEFFRLGTIAYPVGAGLVIEAVMLKKAVFEKVPINIKKGSETKLIRHNSKEDVGIKNPEKMKEYFEDFPDLWSNRMAT